jgi:hypothetical protein
MGLEPSAEDFNNLIVVEARQNRFYNWYIRHFPFPPSALHDI